MDGKLGLSIQRFDPMTLDDLSRFDFENRLDTKYVLSLPQLFDLLSLLPAHLKVLDIKNERVFEYFNTYYDDRNFSNFKHHHQKRNDRIKIRKRTYGKSGLSYFEVKQKTNKSVTLKKRFKLSNEEANNAQKIQQILDDLKAGPWSDYEAVVQNNFSRVTLATPDFVEKFTLDFGLTATFGDNEHVFENLVIAELKQPKHNRHSPFYKALRLLKISPSSFSKYCMSVIQHHTVKHNEFKPLIRYLNKITHAAA